MGWFVIEQNQNFQHKGFFGTICNVKPFTSIERAQKYADEANDLDGGAYFIVSDGYD